MQPVTKPRSVYFAATVMPLPGQTTVQVTPTYTTDRSWTDEQEEVTCTTLVIGGLTIQFDSPEEALDWLQECRTGVIAAVRVTL